jgi:hypothetical protein
MMPELQKAVNIVDTPTPATNVGILNSTWTHRFEDRYFSPGDVIRYGDGSHARVMEEPFMVDGTWTYTLQLVNASPDSFVDPAAVAVGKQVAKIGTGIYEEFSDQGSGTSSPSPIYFENIMTTMRKTITVTGDALTEVAAIDFTIDGQKMTYWCAFEEWLALQELLQGAEYWLQYGEKTETPSGDFTIFGKNGRPIKAGAGFLAQIANSNQGTYTNMTEGYLQEYLMHLQMQANASSGTRFVLRTGAGGYREVQNAIKDAVKSNPNTTDLGKYYVMRNGKSLMYAPNQWITYEGLFGTTVTVVHDPMMDNPKLFTDRDPATGLPKESFRLVFMDMSDYNGEPNIQIVHKAGNGEDRSLRYWFEAGSHAPPGQTVTPMRSSGVDGYTQHWLKQEGIMVKNPYACGQLVKSFS